MWVLVFLGLQVSTNDLWSYLITRSPEPGRQNQVLTKIIFFLHSNLFRQAVTLSPSVSIIRKLFIMFKELTKTESLFSKAMLHFVDFQIELKEVL